VKPHNGVEERATHAIQLFDSVLWVFKGTTRTTWVASEPAAADVVVVHHSEPAQHVERWHKAGKLIVVLSTDEGARPAAPRTLVYPFPAVQVLSLLERMEAELGGAVDETIATGPAPASDPWTFVEALRTVRAVSNPDLWLVARSTNGPLLWLQGDGSRYYCDAVTARAIRSGTLALSGLTLRKGTAPPKELNPRLGIELSWFATYHAQAMLAPWLDASLIYRLTRWPDFGLLRAHEAEERSAQMRIVAALEAQPAEPDTLAARARTSTEQVLRIVNALAVCGLIEPAAARTPLVAHRAPVPASGLRRFLRNMRKHLGMGASA
jgi:hypothetical protein